MNRAHHFPVIGDHQRSSPLLGDIPDARLHHFRQSGSHKFADSVRSALPVLAAVYIHSAHAGFRSERNEFGLFEVVKFPFTNAELFGKHDYAAPLWSFIGQGGQLGCIGQFLDGNARGGQEFDGLPIAESDRPGFVQQKHVHIPGSLNGSTAHGKNIMLNQPVDARNADGAKKAADGGGHQAYEKSDKDGYGKQRMRIQAEGLEGRHHYDEKDGEGSKKNGESDFIGRLLPLGAFDQVDHMVHEALAGIGGHPDGDPIGENAGASGYRAPVASRLTDHGRRLARDGRLIHTCRPFNDFAVSGDHLAGLNNDNVVLSQRLGRNSLCSAARLAKICHCPGAGFAEGIGLGLAAPLGHSLGKIGKKHRKPQPYRYLQGKPDGFSAHRSNNQLDRSHNGADQSDEDHRVSCQVDRIELYEAAPNSGQKNRSIKK